MRELINVKRLFGKRIIIGFVDDDFCAKSNEEIKAFCNRYEEYVGLPFFCASTPSSINKEKIGALISAGLVRLEMGIQTTSDKINKEIDNMPVLMEKAVEAIKFLEKYRYKVDLCFDFILDNPWEKEDTLIESLNFILTIKKLVSILLFSLTLCPGTILYERGTKESLLKMKCLKYMLKTI